MEKTGTSPESALEAYHELTNYTLAHRDPAFIHQYVVDAFAAQFADEQAKPITLAFALIGLYLHVVQGFSGREVQKAHIRMGKVKKSWPKFVPPSRRGDITVFDVLRALPGKDRDRAIDEWSSSVWSAWRDSHARVAQLVHSELGI